MIKAYPGERGLFLALESLLNVLLLSLPFEKSCLNVFIIFLLVVVNAHYITFLAYYLLKF
jgi:hypothetical protein